MAKDRPELSKTLPQAKSWEKQIKHKDELLLNDIN
jgi:hypothetical protein